MSEELLEAEAVEEPVPEGDARTAPARPIVTRADREELEAWKGEVRTAAIAAAGGIVAEEDSFALLRATTHVVWLKASPAEHMSRVMEQGDFRPMGRNREAMKDLIAILEAREPEYRRAHAQIDTSGRAVEECVAELAETAARLFAGGG